MNRQALIDEAILKETQHNDTSTLRKIHQENPNFQWFHISYKKTGDTPLHIAARLDYTEIIEYLLTNFKLCAVDIKNKDDKTALHEACQFARLNSVLTLCSYGADVNVLRRGDWTPLMLACTKVQPDVNYKIVKFLVSQGAQVNVQNKDGWYCVHLLAREGGDEIFDFLIQMGLKTAVKTKNGRTALHIAALHGNQEFVSRMLSYIDINARDNCGNTALHEAVLGGHVHLVKFLIDKGADVHSKNNSDLGLIHLAASQENFKIIDFILTQLKFDIDSKTSCGWTPLHCAARKGSRDMYEYLKKIGASETVQDNYGRTASEYFNNKIK